MTDTLIDRADSGEIPKMPGEHRIRIDLGEPTQRIDPRLIKAPSFDAIPRKVFDLDDTVTYLPQTIGVVPDPETERLSLLGSVAGVDGDLRPAAPGPFPTPLPPNPPPAPQPKPSYAGRHRLTFGRRVRRLLAGLGVVGAALVAIWAGLSLAALAVFL